MKKPRKSAIRDRESWNLIGRFRSRLVIVFIKSPHFWQARQQHIPICDMRSRSKSSYFLKKLNQKEFEAWRAEPETQKGKRLWFFFFIALSSLLQSKTQTLSILFLNGASRWGSDPPALRSNWPRYSNFIVSFFSLHLSFGLTSFGLMQLTRQSRVPFRYEFFTFSI